MEINLADAGKRIYHIRTQHKYSMAAFAKLIGNSSASTVNNWEKGNNLPKHERLEKIAILGNKTTNWILYGEFEEYVYQLLQSSELKQKLSNDQFRRLIKKLHSEKISYQDDLAILSTTHELFPQLFELAYDSFPNDLPLELIAEEPTEYIIENDQDYRTTILPRIESLLINSNSSTSNRQLLLQLLEIVSYAPLCNQVNLLNEILLSLLIIVRNNTLTTPIDQIIFNNQESVNTTDLNKVCDDLKEKMNTFIDTFYVTHPTK